MIGRKVPATHSRAILDMLCNVITGRKRKKVKKQARKEDRHYLMAQIAGEYKRQVGEIKK
jgi:hypothetical protein